MSEETKAVFFKTPVTLRVATSVLVALTLAIFVSCGGGGGGGGSAPPPTISVSVSPSTASVTVGSTQQFTATVSGTSNQAVTWSVNGTTGGSSTSGTISTSGLYTTPDLVPSSASVTVTATSQADTTKSRSATVSLAYPSPRLSSVSPAYVLVNAADTTLTVTGSGFTRASTMALDDVSLETSFVTSAELTATVPASLETVAAVHKVRVTNPPPGGGTSATPGQFLVNALVRNPYSNPPVIVAGRSTTLKVSAFVIGVGSTSAVQLFAVDGDTLSKIGDMTDDGMNGDATAGDNVYTGQASLTESRGNVATLRVIVSIAGTNVGQGDLTLEVLQIPPIQTDAAFNETVEGIYSQAIDAQRMFASIKNQSFQPGVYNTIAADAQAMFAGFEAVTSQDYGLPLLDLAIKSSACNLLVNSLAGNQTPGQSRLPLDDPRVVDFAKQLAAKPEAISYGYSLADFLDPSSPTAFEAYYWAHGYVLTGSVSTSLGCEGGLLQETSRTIVKEDLSQYFSLALDGVTQLFGDLGSMIIKGAQAVGTMVGYWVDLSGISGIAMGKVGDGESFQTPSGTYNLYYSFGGSNSKAKITNTPVYAHSTTIINLSPGATITVTPPNITNFAPTSGPVGTTVIISGSGFSPDISGNEVTFGGTVASVSSAIPTSLTAVVPSGATSGPISVTTSTGTAVSASSFTVFVQAVVVTVSPSTAQIPAGGLQQFTATVTGTSNVAVTWSVNGVGGGNSTVGTISTAGLFTAPTTVPNPATVTVTATSQAFPSVSGSASVTIGPYNETPVYSFTSLSDGAAPSAPLIQASDGHYYGTAQVGGTYGYGTVFKVDSSGNVTPLHEFSGTDDGAYPTAALIQAGDGYFYGTTLAGGDSSCTAIYGFTGCGTIFKMDSSGNLTTLHSFSGGTEGAGPLAGMTVGTDGYLYGTTFYGGAQNAGTVFKSDAFGNLATMYSFSGGTDGLGPEGSLIQAKDGYFYGVTEDGGDLSCEIWPAQGCGTIFRTDSAGNLTTLYAFTGGADGANPDEALLQASDGFFYGTTLFGGDPTCTVSTYTGCGTIFKIDSAGNFTTMHEFSGGSEGGVPFSTLIQASDDDFYGTATAGGDPSCSVIATGFAYPTYIGCGTVFKMDLSGNVNALYSFTGTPDDGSNPFASLVEGSDGFFYGTTRWGGTNSSCPYTNNGGCGTVFKVAGPGGPLSPQQTTESNRSVTRSLNPKPLTPQSRPVPRAQTGQEPARPQNVRGVKQPASVR